HSQLTQSSARGKLGKFFEDTTAADVLNHFKAELDQLRRILWFYIEEAAGQPVVGMDHEQQAKRLQRVTELLRALSPQPGITSAANCPPSSGSFFERLNLVIDSYMQEKPPAESKPAKRTQH